jgi:hypothetical protein
MKLGRYRAVREAAKERQVSTLPAKGQKGFQANVREKTPEHSAPTATREVRAKAASTNSNYISIDTV